MTKKARVTLVVSSEGYGTGSRSVTCPIEHFYWNLKVLSSSDEGLIGKTLRWYNEKGLKGFGRGIDEFLVSAIVNKGKTMAHVIIIDYGAKGTFWANGSK
jgi:hypothetical protein